MYEPQEVEVEIDSPEMGLLITEEAEPIHPYSNVKSMKQLLKFFDIINQNEKFYYLPRNMALPESKLSDILDEVRLIKIGSDCKSGYDSDKQTMNDWSQHVKEARETYSYSNESSIATKSDAKGANYCTPLFSSICQNFSNVSFNEQLRRKDMVSFTACGSDLLTEDEEDAAERLAKFMNYQINTSMKGWRDEHRKLIYDLPVVGTVFKRMYYDHLSGTNRSDLITYPNFAVNNHVSSQARITRFSQTYKLTRFEIEEKMHSGYWREDGEFNPLDDQEDSYIDENLIGIIEQECWFDIDNDGVPEPYSVTIIENSSHVLAMYPRFEINEGYGSIVFKTDETDDLALESISPSEIPADAEIRRIEESTSIVKYGFLPDPKGGYLDVGFAPVLSKGIDTVNTTTNQALDAGTLKNRPTIIKTSSYPEKFQVGKINYTNKSASQINGAIQMPFIGTGVDSSTLALKQVEEGHIKNYGGSVDFASMAANTPALTAMAQVEQSSSSAGAITTQMIASMTKEFNILHKLNKAFVSDAEYAKVVNKPVSFYDDCKIVNWELKPTASPEFSSKAMRLQKASMLIQTLTSLSQVNMGTPLVGFDPTPMAKKAVELMGEEVSEVFPEQQPMQKLEELMKDPEVNEFVTKSQEQADEAMDNANMIAETQAQAINKERDAKTDLLQADAVKRGAETEKVIAETDKVEADEGKSLAQTEEIITESQKNRVATAQIARFGEEKEVEVETAESIVSK